MDTLLEDQNIIQHEIHDEMKESYIDYAMSVIVGRALPDEAGTQKNFIWNVTAWCHSG